MRINKFVAASSPLSRRAADQAVLDGRVLINGAVATAGSSATEADHVTLDGRAITPAVKLVTILLHKPIGYVCSTRGQGSHTIYELLPDEYQQLNPVGRLDKDSSGILVMTNDGQLAQMLSHPSYSKTKVYEIKLGKALLPLHHQMIANHGIELEDGNSRLGLERMVDGDDHQWRVTMQEGRNRQIRRTFEALGYAVVRLKRTEFGQYSLDRLRPAEFIVVE
jgi:23S rRNA pseudouridine2605 synthase